MKSTMAVLEGQKCRPIFKSYLFEIGIIYLVTAGPTPTVAQGTLRPSELPEEEP